MTAVHNKGHVFLSRDLLTLVFSVMGGSGAIVCVCVCVCARMTPKSCSKCVIQLRRPTKRLNHEFLCSCAPSTGCCRTEGTDKHATRGGGVCAPTAPCIPSPCFRASLSGGLLGRVHCAVGGRAGWSPRDPLELLCWKGLRGSDNCLAAPPVLLDLLIICWTSALPSGVFGRGLRSGVRGETTQRYCTLSHLVSLQVVPNALQLPKALFCNRLRSSAPHPVTFALAI